MGNETKKRLFLTKWRGELETLREKVETLEGQIGDHDSDVADLLDTLEAVKYWLHDGLVMGRLVSNPRDILRKVEDALG